MVHCLNQSGYLNNLFKSKLITSFAVVKLRDFNALVHGM